MSGYTPIEDLAGGAIIDGQLHVITGPLWQQIQRERRDGPRWVEALRRGPHMGPVGVMRQAPFRWRYDGLCQTTDEDHERGPACHPFLPHSHRDGSDGPIIKWARRVPA